MKAIIDWNDKKYEINFSKLHDLSIPMQSGDANPNAFHIPSPRFEPIKVGDFVGSVAQGSGANCENLMINAHGNGTHTECIGHITKERVSINQSLKHFHYVAQVISLEPIQLPNGDWAVPKDDVENRLEPNIQALIIRTLPNSSDKLTQFYSGNNPCYLLPELTALLAEKQIEHLLVDLPSVDREEDAGAMAAHKAFWCYPEKPRINATISEMVFVENSIADGIYFLNIQIASLETDASPSKPVLYGMDCIG
ncbi:MAG: metal-dependent hydrolase [Bacteroidetes bacterium B1(2017)]|nr:MAG: metal-dependent hydrolase [Bacteroidetes bacterium B1(2017)]